MLIKRITLAKLPKWVLTDPHIAFNDIESVTAIEMVARLYGKMQELIEDYNNYADQINDEIEKFETGVTKTIEEFKECVTNIMNDYIKSVDTKLALQDSKIEQGFADQNDRITQKFAEQDAIIEEAVQYMKDNLLQSVTNLFQEYLENGDIHVNLFELYEEEPEFLSLGVSDTDFPTRNIAEELDKAKGVTVTITNTTSSHKAEAIRNLIRDGTQVTFIKDNGGNYSILDLIYASAPEVHLIQKDIETTTDGTRRLAFTKYIIYSTGNVTKGEKLVVNESV